MAQTRRMTKEERWHIISIMKHRGVGHCDFCKRLLKKLEKWEQEEDGTN